MNSEAPEKKQKCRPSDVLLVVGLIIMLGVIAFLGWIILHRSQKTELPGHLEWMMQKSELSKMGALIPITPKKMKDQDDIVTSVHFDEIYSFIPTKDDKQFSSFVVVFDENEQLRMLIANSKWIDMTETNSDFGDSVDHFCESLCNQYGELYSPEPYDTACYRSVLHTERNYDASWNLTETKWWSPPKQGRLSLPAGSLKHPWKYIWSKIGYAPSEFENKFEKSSYRDMVMLGWPLENPVWMFLDLDYTTMKCRTSIFMINLSGGNAEFTPADILEAIPTDVLGVLYFALS